MSKPPTQKKIREMMQFTLRKHIENKKKHSNYKSLSPKGYIIWMDFSHSTFKQSKLAGKTQWSQEVLTHIKRLQLETWMWLTKRMHQKAWCVLEVRSHIPQTLHHQKRLKKNVSEPSSRYGRFIECSSHETEYLSSMTPNQSQTIETNI